MADKDSETAFYDYKAKGNEAASAKQVIYSFLHDVPVLLVTRTMFLLAVVYSSKILLRSNPGGTLALLP
jgi:hypothetical protein